MLEFTRESKLVSVIVPCYNSEDYLFNCLQSIQQQTYEKFEVLIVDDGSSDRSLGIAQDFVTKDSRFRLLANEQNMGVAYSRSKGFRESAGEFVALLDSDDESLPGRLEQQLKYFLERPELDVLGGGCELFDVLTGRYSFESYPNEHYTLLLMLLTDMPFCNSSLMFRASSLKGIYDFYYEEFAPAEDYEFLVRLKLNGLKFSNLDAILVRRNVHPESITFTKQENLNKSRIKIISSQLRTGINSPVEDLAKIFFHYHYSRKTVSDDLAKVVLKNIHVLRKLGGNNFLSKLHGDKLWRGFVQKVSKELIRQSLLKLGFLRFLKYSILGRLN